MKNLGNTHKTVQVNSSLTDSIVTQWFPITLGQGRTSDYICQNEASFTA